MKNAVYSLKENGEWEKSLIDSLTTPPTIIDLPTTLYERKNGFSKDFYNKWVKNTY
jgi:hypothetical protein